MGQQGQWGRPSTRQTSEWLRGPASVLVIFLFGGGHGWSQKQPCRRSEGQSDQRWGAGLTGWLNLFSVMGSVPGVLVPGSVLRV